MKNQKLAPQKWRTKILKSPLRKIITLRTNSFFHQSVQFLGNKRNCSWHTFCSHICEKIFSAANWCGPGGHLQTIHRNGSLHTCMIQKYIAIAKNIPYINPTWSEGVCILRDCFRSFFAGINITHGLFRTIQSSWEDSSNLSNVIIMGRPTTSSRLADDFKETFVLLPTLGVSSCLINNLPCEKKKDGSPIRHKNIDPQMMDFFRSSPFRDVTIPMLKNPPKQMGLPNPKSSWGITGYHGFELHLYGKTESNPIFFWP